MTNASGQDLYDRMKRLETKLTRGFEEMGIDTYETSDWITVENASHTLYVSSLGRGLQVINTAAKKLGAIEGKVYDIVWRGKCHATLQIF